MRSQASKYGWEKITPRVIGCNKPGKILVISANASVPLVQKISAFHPVYNNPHPTTMPLATRRHFLQLMLAMVVVCAYFVSPSARAADAPVAKAKPSAAPTETKEHKDARMAWWREAKFGMFIHWGLYAVPGGYYHDKPVGGFGEWIMNKGKIPVAEYANFAKQFNPVKFNADEWVLLAKSAGFTSTS